MLGQLYHFGGKGSFVGPVAGLEVGKSHAVRSGKLTWNLTEGPLRTTILFKGPMLRLNVSFPECMSRMSWPHVGCLQGPLDGGVAAKEVKLSFNNRDTVNDIVSELWSPNNNPNGGEGVLLGFTSLPQLRENKPLLPSPGEALDPYILLCWPSSRLPS